MGLSEYRTKENCRRASVLFFKNSGIYHASSHSFQPVVRRSQPDTVLGGI